jgi:hypothetical protein
MSLEITFLDIYISYVNKACRSTVRIPGVVIPTRVLGRISYTISGTITVSWKICLRQKTLPSRLLQTSRRVSSSGRMKSLMSYLSPHPTRRKDGKPNHSTWEGLFTTSEGDLAYGIIPTLRFTPFYTLGAVGLGSLELIRASRECL